jgi:hypothetical protein
VEALNLHVEERIRADVDAAEILDDLGEGDLVLAAAAPALAGNWNTIDSVRPRIGQRGKTVEVTINGSYLLDAQEIVFYRPGIRVVSIEPIGKPPEKPVPYWPKLKCMFEIAPDCPVGEHVFRVRSLTQLSMAATFNVTPFPVVDEVESVKDRGIKDNRGIDRLELPGRAVIVADMHTTKGSGDHPVGGR